MIYLQLFLYFEIFGLRYHAINPILKRKDALSYTMTVDSAMIEDKMSTYALEHTQEFSKFHLFFSLIEVVDFNAFEAIREEDVEHVELMMLIVLLLQQQLYTSFGLLF